MDNNLIHIVILGILSIGFFVLVVWVYSTYQRSLSIKYFSGFLLGLAILAGVSASILVEQSDASLLFVTRLGYYTGAITTVMFLMFSLYYPVPSQKIPQNNHLFWVLPLVFFLPYIFLNPYFVESVFIENGLPKENVGSLYFVLPLFVVTYFIISIRNLIVKLPFVAALRKQLKLVIGTIIFAGGSSITLDVILPAFGVRFPHYIAQEIAIAIYGVTSYIVLKRN
ncbi:MAG: hypothetical protein ABII24_02620 [bacterium]